MLKRLLEKNKIIYNKYREMDGRSKKMVLCGIYTLSFILAAAIIFRPFVSAHKGFVWYGDGLTVQYPAFVYFGKFLRSIVKGILTGTGVPMFDFNIGMGADIIQFLSMWYFEPITILSAFVPVQYSEILYNILVMVRFYLAGVVFLYLCHYFKKFNLYAVAGALIYVFSGYTLYFIKHPMLFGGLLYLPLLIVGVDKMVRTKRISLFCAFVVFISLVASYYFLYVNTLICGIYFIIRYITLRGINQVKIFFLTALKICVTWVIGIGMAMMVFLPTFLSYLNSNRRDPIISTENLFSYGQKWFRNLFVHMFSPYEDTKFWLYNGYVIIALVAVCVLFMIKKQYTILKGAVVIVGILFSMPIFTFVFYGFNSINHRWSYVVGLVLAIISVCMFPKMRELETKKMKWLIFVGIFYTFFVVVGDYDVNLQSIYTMLACMALWVTIALVFYFNLVKTEELIYKGVILLLVFCQCVVYGYYTYGERFGNYVSEFMDAGSVNEYLLSTSANVDIEDDSFYRREAADGQKMLVNSALLAEYNGVPVCTNQQTKYVQGFNDMTENRANTIAEMYDLDNRTFLETLCGVKYFMAEEGQSDYIPYGFEKYKVSGNTIIYKNNNYLPLGVTYSSILNPEEFAAMNPVQRQEAMLQGIQISEDYSGIKNQYMETKVELNSENLDYVLKDVSGVEINGTTYNVYEDGAKITLQFESIENAELYFRVVGFSADKLGDVDIDCTVSVSRDGEEFSKSFKVRSATNQYTIPGKYNYLTNLGYQEEKVSEITFTFPVCGEYEIKGIEIYEQKLDDYSDYVGLLKREILQDVEISTNNIAGTIKVSEDKILYLAIPYSEGWTALIDGEETEIYRANEMFMCVPLEAGEHTVELEYQTPGLKVGTVITMFSFGVFFLLLCYRCKVGKNRLTIQE